jgi:glycosyltransferase involved in cell wall biosynthesis
VVVSIHDLSFEHLPETFKRRSRAQLRLTVRRSARKATHILALSEHARADIVATYGIPPDRITAIPLAAADRFQPVVDERELQRVRHTYGIAGDYILTVGSIQPRKNLGRLIAAYARLRTDAKVGRPQLVIVGRQAWLVGETLRAIKDSGFSDSIILTGYVPDDDLPALYSGARCFVYPSFFEGFGLPPLEAMKCGVPVVAGNRTSLVEVVGDAGILVDPLDPEAIALGLSQVLSDEDLREELGSRGLERSRLFNWRATAKRTLEVYERAADNERSVRIR